MVLACFCFALSSCVDSKVAASLSDHEQQQIKDIAVAKKSVYSSEYKELRWKEALTMLYKGNSQYESSRRTVQDTAKLRKEIWHEFLPNVYSFANITTAFDQLVRFRFQRDDLDVGLRASLNIPSPFQLYSQSYLYALREIQAENNHELLRRRLYLDLWRAFSSYHDLQKKVDDIMKPIPESLPLKEQIRLKVNQENRLSTLDDSRERLRLRINSLLNTPNANWALVGDIPQSSYARRIDQLELDQGYGTLALKMQTVQIEFAQVALKSNKRVRLPNISWNVFAPTLYDSTAENNADFRIENFRLFTGVNKTIQLEDVFNQEAVQNAEYRYGVTRERMMLNIESEASKLESSKRKYKKLLVEKEFTRKNIESLKKSHSSKYGNSIILKIKEIEGLQQKLNSLDNQEELIDLEFWIWDEQYWSKN